MKITKDKLKALFEQELQEMAKGKSLQELGPFGRKVAGLAAGVAAMGAGNKAMAYDEAPQAWDSTESKDDYTMRVTNKLLSSGKYDKLVEKFMQATGEIGQIEKTMASNEILRAMEKAGAIKPGSFNEIPFQQAIAAYGNTKGGGATSGAVKKDASGPKVQDAGDKYIVTVDISHTNPSVARDVAPGRAVAALGRYLGKNLADYKGASNVVLNKDGTATVTLEKGGLKEAKVYSNKENIMKVLKEEYNRIKKERNRV